MTNYMAEIFFLLTGNLENLAFALDKHKKCL